MAGLTSRRQLGFGLGAAALASRWPPEARATALDATALSTRSNCGFPCDPSRLWAGSTSHYLQPWRTLIQTRSYDTLRNGIGTQNSGWHDAASLPMLAEHGFRHIRSAWNWNQVSYTHPNRISPADPDYRAAVAYLRAIKAAGMRPLLVLQAFNQGPCPALATTIPLAQSYVAGQATMTLAGTRGLVPDYSGPYAFWTPASVTIAKYCDPRANSAPAAFFTRFDGNVATLSKPLAVDIPAGGAGIIIHTLKFKPFGQAGSADYAATMDGWVGYVEAVSKIMQEIYGTAGHADLGFDLEIWNELTFGSQFLDINNYYAPPVATMSNDATGQPAVWGDILKRTSAHIEANPADYAGVRVVNGFTNTTPFFSAPAMPVAISAMSKHAYPSLLAFPAQDEGVLLDSTGQRTSFKPTYTFFAPEAAFSDVQVYELFYDVAEVTNMSSGTPRGIHSRRIDGVTEPVDLWMTEVGTPTAEHGVTQRDAMWRLLAKGLLRIVFFNAAVGVERSYIFKAVGDPAFFAIVDEAAPTRPTLPVQALARALALIRGDGDAAAGALIPFRYEVTVPAGKTANILWHGDGTPSCPDFRHPDDFVLFPVQVNPKRIAFVYWFHCLDMRRDMIPTRLALTIFGLPGAVGSASAHDPLDDVTYDVKTEAGEKGAINFSSLGSDRPQILLVTLV